MAKKSRAQKIQESTAQNEATTKKHLSKYALKKLAQQNSWYEEPLTENQESSQEGSSSSDTSTATANAGANDAKSTTKKASGSTNRRTGSSSSKGKKTTTRLSLRTNKRQAAPGSNTELSDEEYLANQQRRQAKAKAKAIKAAMEGANGIEKVERNTRGNKKSVTFSRKGNVITVVRKETKLDPHKEAKAQEHRAKLERHAQAVRDARNEALAKLAAEGKKYQRPNRDLEAIPDKIEFDRKVVETCGVQIKDRLPNLTDLAERQAAMMPHNRRDQMLFAPIKRETQPIKGTDFMVKFLDSWSRRNDTQGIFTSLFEQVKAVRQNENGIAYIGLPAFLKFLEGASKNKIIDDYAFDFRQFIKRREITDFISSMQAPALQWAKNRPALEPYYAFVYFDTYPMHIKLGKKKVINVHTLFILGVTLDGRKDILGIVPDLTSSRVSVSFWDAILSHLKDLGCSEICFAVAAFKCRYLERSMKNHFPDATMHFNLLELLQFDSFSLPEDMRSQFMEDAKALAESVNYDEAYSQLLAMRDKWESYMREGETILQGSLDYLKVHTLLAPQERKVFSSQKIVSQAAALLMGNKAPDDFFSDNAEMLTYLFYRYLLIGKQYWIEHQDYAVNNLCFSKIFSQLRHLDISGAKLLNTLLLEQHQEFMYRHFGQFGNGPVFNLNPNKKRISLSGQIDDNAAVRGDSWNDTSNAALNTANEPQEAQVSSQAPDMSPKGDANTASGDRTSASASANHGASASTGLASGASADGNVNANANANAKAKAGDAGAGSETETGTGAQIMGTGVTCIKDIEGSDLTLNDDHKFNSNLVLGLNAPKSMFDSEVKLTENSLEKTHIFSMDNMHSFENNAFMAFGGLELDQSSSAFLHESSATLTLNSTSSTSFIEKQDLMDYEGGKLTSAPEETKTKVNSKPSKLAVALRFEYPKFKQRQVLVNGQEYVLTHAALGDLDPDKLNHQVLQNNSDIKGIDKVDGTFGFKVLRSKRMSNKSVAPSHTNLNELNNNGAIVLAKDTEDKQVTAESALKPTVQSTTANTGDHSSNIHLSYSRHFNAQNDPKIYKVGNGLSSLKHQYDVDSVAGLDGLDTINFVNELGSEENNKQPSTYLDSVSSNIQRANAVMGMLRPSIAQALRKDRLDLKKKDRELISLCLGSDFNFDEVNNVIHQVTPIFRSAMQNKIAMKAEKEAQKKAQERQRKKEKARERYLKRQEQKAALALQNHSQNDTQNELTDKDFEPINASDFNPLNGVNESSALSGDKTILPNSPITITNADQSEESVMPKGLILTNSASNQSLELSQATNLDGLFESSHNDEGSLTLIKPSDAKVQVVAPEYRSSIAQQMAINSPLGVQTQKPDQTIKLKD